jgi:hypothetical protein
LIRFFENIKGLRRDEIGEIVYKLDQCIQDYKKLGLITWGSSQSKISPDGKSCLFSVVWRNRSEYDYVDGYVVYPNERSYTVKIGDNNETDEKVQGILF